MDKKIREILKVIVFIVLLISFITLTIQIKRNNILKIDKIIYKNFIEIRNNNLNNLFKIFTCLGNVFITLLIMIISAIFIKNVKYRKIIFINLFNIVMLNIILKNIFMRPRPNFERLINEIGYSFPSGHAMVATAFYGMFMYFICKECKNKRIFKTITIIIMTSIIALISISRVYLGVHYFSDILAGILISCIYLIIFIFIIEKYLKKTQLEVKKYE